MIFFSIIITTYNRRNLLTRAVNSLISQDEKDWECIIVDDGSIDETNQYVIEICKQNKNFIYIYQSNHGQAYSRNIGLINGNGKFATFLDSDDEYEPGHLKSRKKILMENPGIQLLHGGTEIIGNRFVPDRNNKSLLIPLDECIIGGTFFLNRVDAIELGGFPIVPYSDDSLFFDKVMAAGWNIQTTDIPTYIYHRDTPDSICNNFEQNSIQLHNI